MSKNIVNTRKKHVKKGGNHDIEVIGKGDDGCVLKGVIPSNCSSMYESLPVPPFNPNEVITKVATKHSAFEKEWTTAKILHTLDPRQEHMLYPFAACESSLPLDERTFEDCNFNPSDSSKGVFLLQMRFGGKSLKQMKDQGETLTPEQAAKVIEDMRAALFKLHSSGYVHGDLHHGNVVVQKNNATGEVKAYLIDFGYFKPITDQDKLTEVKNFLERIILKTVSEIAEGGRFRVLDVNGMVVKYPSFSSVQDVSYSFVPAFSPVKASPVRSFLNFGSPSDPSTSAQTPQRPVKSRFERSAMKTTKRDLFGDF